MSRIRVLGVFTLSMINIAAIARLRSLPTTAELGLSSIFLYLAAAFVFFLPASLVAAELATGWPTQGGVYTWVKRAFGARAGFTAMFLQWGQNLFFYPTALSFVASALSYLIDPSLSSNKIYMVSMIVGIYWLFTFINCFGMRTSGFISIFCAIFGAILPVCFIFLLASYWILSSHPIQFHTNWHAWMPRMERFNNWVFLIGVISTLVGIEMSAVHVREVENPKQQYPKAIFIALIVTLILLILGSISIATVVPRNQISLVAGVMEAVSLFLSNYHLHFLVPLVAIMIALGGLGQISTWIVGPSKGLMWTAHDGDIPPFFQRLNKYRMPVPIFILQAIIVTGIALIYLFMPTVSNSFWVLIVVTVQSYLMMYVLMFLAAIRLRYKRPKVQRTYRVPFGNFGMWFFACLGIAGALFALAIGFIPPLRFHTKSILEYDLFLTTVLCLMLIIPNVIYSLKKESWVKEDIELP